jgi:hypothetical protein
MNGPSLSVRTPIPSKPKLRSPFSVDGRSQLTSTAILALLLLENALLEDPLDGERRIDDVDFSIGASSHGELPDGLPVLEDAIIDDDTGNDEGILVLLALEREVTQLDFNLVRIGHSGIRRDERPIGPRWCRRKKPHQQETGANRAPVNAAPGAGMMHRSFAMARTGPKDRSLAEPLSANRELRKQSLAAGGRAPVLPVDRTS